MSSDPAEAGVGEGPSQSTREQTLSTPCRQRARTGLELAWELGGVSEVLPNRAIHSVFQIVFSQLPPFELQQQLKCGILCVRSGSMNYDVRITTQESVRCL